MVAGPAFGVIGIDAVRSGGVTRFRRWAMILAIVGLGIVVFAYAVLALQIGGMY
jgi:hypothetical protein